MRRYLRRNKLQKILKYDETSGIFYSQKTKQTVGTIDVNGNVQIRIEGIRYMADKLAWFCVHGEWPKHPLVHIDGINSNNWLSNLKILPEKKKRKNNKSDVTGVSRDTRDNKWRAQITVYNKQMNLGNHENFELAVLARFKAEQLYNYDLGSTAHQYLQKMFL